MRSFLLLASLFLAACGGGATEPNAGPSETQEPPAPATTSFSLLPEARSAWETLASSVSDNSTLILGSFYEELSLEMDDATVTTLTATKYSDGYLGRLDGAGRMRWLLQIASTGGCGPLAMDRLPDDSVIAAFWYRTNLTLPSRGGADLTLRTDQGVALARYSADGERLWAVVAAEGKNVRVNDLSVWSDGSSAFCGRLSFPTTFGPGTAGETTIDADPDFSATHEYYARFDAQGALHFAATLTGATLQTEARSCQAMRDGSLVVAGMQQSDVTIGGTTLPLPSGASVAGYLARISATGTVRWARAFTAPDVVVPGDMNVRSDGRILATGTFNRTATLESRAGPLALDPRLSSRHGYLATLDEDGYVESVRTIGDTNFLAYMRVIELADGGVALAGSARSTLYLDATERLDGLDANTLYHFVIRVDAQGDDVWARADGDGSDLRLYSLLEHPDGSIAVSGSYRNSYTVGLGTADERSTPPIDGNVYRGFYTRFHDDGAFGTR